MRAFNCFSLRCGLTAAVMMMLSQVSMAGQPPKYSKLDPSKTKYIPPIQSTPSYKIAPGLDLHLSKYPKLPTNPVVKIPPGLDLKTPKYPKFPADPVVKIPPGLDLKLPKYPKFPVDPVVKIPPGLDLKLPKYPKFPVDPVVKIPPGLKPTLPKLPKLPKLPDPPATKPAWLPIGWGWGWGWGWPLWPADPTIYVDWYFPGWWFCCHPELFDEWYYTYGMWTPDWSSEVAFVSLPAPQPMSLGMAVVNPASLGATIPFTVDGIAYELAPGARLELDPRQSKIIAFGRGDTLGSARYTLTDGVFTFAVTEKGLELYRTPYRTQEAPQAPTVVMY